jgi:hypothetical protein
LAGDRTNRLSFVQVDPAHCGKPEGEDTFLSFLKVSQTQS